LIERNPLAHDLPRSIAGAGGMRRAIIGDPRNDENVIVSQFHGMMIRFHNRVVSLHPGTQKDFAAARQLVLWHYQSVVLHDFLPPLIDADVLDAVSPGFRDPSKGFSKIVLPPGLQSDGRVFMPVEFSVAAYRLGHSMVRPAYRVNEFTEPIKIFDHSNPTNGLNAFGEFPKSWTIDWNRF